MSVDERGAAASRLAALKETFVVAGLAIAVIWLIPNQTAAGPVLGLKPGLLPTVCAVAIAGIALIALVFRLWQPEPLLPERSAPIWPAALIAAVAIAGVLTLQFVGPISCGVVAIALGLLALGEKRPRIVLPTVAGAALMLASIFQIWR